MKKLIYLLFIVATMFMVACGSKSGSVKSDIEVVNPDSMDAHGLQRMQTSKAEMDISFKGKKYLSVVSRMPDEELPHVSNEMGDVYVDNKITLRLTKDGQNVFEKTFTKRDFVAVVDSDFLAKSVLEGIVFDKTTPQGFVYAASVCYPQTDLYVPMSITISPDGKMSIAKVEMIEDAAPEQE